MSTPAQTLLTVDEFLATADERDGRWELEDGVMYEIESGVAQVMAPERLQHARVKAEIYLALRTAIRRAGLPCEAVPDSVAVRITARTAYQPDALVYCGPRLPGDAREVANPVVVVEVLSPTSIERDMHRKLIGYFSLRNVVHYLILAPDVRTAFHYERKASGVIETRILSDGLLRLDPPGLDLTVTDLFGEP